MTTDDAVRQIKETELLIAVGNPWFVADSALEEAGFELPVPRAPGYSPLSMNSLSTATRHPTKPERNARRRSGNRGSSGGLRSLEELRTCGTIAAMRKIRSKNNTGALLTR
jgi:hypothetical protein